MPNSSQTPEQGDKLTERIVYANDIAKVSRYPVYLTEMALENSVEKLDPRFKSLCTPGYGKQELTGCPIIFNKPIVNFPRPKADDFRVLFGK